MKRTRKTHETVPPTPDSAHAIAAWASSRAPDEVGAIADAIWGLSQKHPQAMPELAEGARAVLASPSEAPHGLVLLASLLEQTASRLRAAADVLDEPRTRFTR